MPSIDKITLTTSNRINGLEEYSKELTADIGINICWLWNVNNLVDMYGVGHAKSWFLGPVSGNLFHNNSGQMCGLGFGYSVKSISIPVGFASWTNTNHGYIMTPTEYSLFVAGLPPLLVPHLAISSIMSLVGDSNINDNEAFDNPITTISSFVPYPGNKNIMITEKALQRYEKYGLIKK